MPLHIDIEKITRFRTLLAGRENVVILAHKNPDGDAVGSMLGLSWLLKKHTPLDDSRLHLLLPNICPETFHFLPGSERILDADTDRDACLNALAQADLIIGVDFNGASRVGTLQQALEQAPAPKVLIDHHHGPDEQLFELVFSAVDLSSACELVHWVGRALWGEDSLSREAARCLYTGLKTDTGSFAFTNEDPSLYEAAAQMVSIGIQAAEIHNEVFNDFSVNRMRFFAFCLSERLRVFEQVGFAYIYVGKEDLERFGMKDADTEGLVNYTLKMRKMQVGVLIKESSTGVRLSLRSKKDFDVNLFARQHWNGGGHTKAAGGNSQLSLEETCQKLENLIIPLLS